MRNDDKRWKFAARKEGYVPSSNIHCRGGSRGRQYTAIAEEELEFRHSEYFLRLVKQFVIARVSAPSMNIIRVPQALMLSEWWCEADRHRLLSRQMSFKWRECAMENFDFWYEKMGVK